MLSKTICINFISVFKTLYGIRASLTNVLFQFFFKMATPPTSTPSPPPASPISSMTLLNPPLSTPTVSTSAISFHNSVTHKLTRDNYSLWKTTVVPILKGHSLFGFVDGTSECPPQTITASSENGDTINPNPAYLAWTMQDQLILGALTSSMTESILSHVVKCTTSRDVWLTLERLFTSHSRARTMQVHYQLATLKKGNTSVADYF